jgi:phosphoribosylformylglycinamidine synthase
VVGEAELPVAGREPRLEVRDTHFDNKPVDLPMAVLFGKPPKMERAYETQAWPVGSALPPLSLGDAIARVLQFPAVASKQFLITIGDRSITGMVARDQMVGPWQVPVADQAITTLSLRSMPARRWRWVNVRRWR